VAAVYVAFCATNDTPTVFNTVPFAVLLRRFEHYQPFQSHHPARAQPDQRLQLPGCTLTHEQSSDFGASWQPRQGVGPIQVQLIHTADLGATRLFDLECSNWILSGGAALWVVPHSGKTLRAILGQLVITTTNGGYLISGYINVWFDLNVGSSFVPANSSAYLELGGHRARGGADGDGPRCGQCPSLLDHPDQCAIPVAEERCCSAHQLDDLGAALSGTTTNLCVTDAVIGQTNRYYRVRLSP
jgi:hypothetical protein